MHTPVHTTRRGWLCGVTTALLLSGSPATHAAPPSAPSERGGYWLSVDCVGDTAALTDAHAALRDGLELTRAPSEESPPGALLGSTDEPTDAIAWLARHAFAAAVSTGSPERISTVPAPVPAGALVHDHGVVVRAFIVTGATASGALREVAWPADQRSLLPPGLEWTAASLTVDRAPLFAAPAPTVPPAAQRHAMVRRTGGLFVLGWLDRCDDSGRCLRWAQVVARTGDRFMPGYVPAFMVAAQHAWVRGGAALPRAQVLRSGVRDGHAELLLLARDRHGELHRKRVTAPMIDGKFPSTDLKVEGDWITLQIAGLHALRIAADATMDLRSRTLQP